MKIVMDDLSGTAIAQFLEEHVREMRAVSPPDSKHALDLAGLRIPEVTFWSVLDDDLLVGCGAVKRPDAGHGEIKSMRVAPSHRKRGVASTLLRHIITEARDMGLVQLSLETGSSEFFEPARRLYLKHGFEYCEPFADYEPDPNSVFLTRPLS